MSNAISRAARALWAYIGFVFVALSLAYCAVRAFDPPRLNWGDSGSDYNVLTSGRNFDKYGFIAMRFTPHLLEASTMQMPRDRSFLYTHYPQLPDLMNGVFRRVLGLSTFVQFRFAALLFSFAALFFIYRLISDYWERQTAQVALALWVSNPMWIQHADYLHHIPYGAFFGFGSVYALTRYLKGGERAGWLVLSAAMLFLTIFASYDWWFCAPLLVAAVTMWHYKAYVSGPVLRVLSILAAVTILAVGLKFASNVWALGGWSAFAKDLSFQFRERASNAVTKTDYRAGIWSALVGRVDRFFTLLLFLVTGVWCAAPSIRKYLKTRGIEVRPVVNPLVLLAVAVPFLYLFVEVWVAQYYPAVQVIPFYAVASGCLIVLLVESRTRIAQFIGIAVLAILLGNSIDEDLTFPIAFFEPAAIATLGPQLDAVSPPSVEVLLNNVFDAEYRYYFNRRMMTTMLIPLGRADAVLRNLGDVHKEPNRSTTAGAIFVQHKRVADQLYDKGYYYLVDKYKLWDLWGNPRKHRAEFDQVVTTVDSTIAASAARVGVKLYDTPYYTIWRILPPSPAPLH